MNWLRCRIGISLLRSTIMCMRGSRSSYNKPVLSPISEGSIDIASYESKIKIITVLVFVINEFNINFILLPYVCIYSTTCIHTVLYATITRSPESVIMGSCYYLYYYYIINVIRNIHNLYEYMYEFPDF